MNRSREIGAFAFLSLLLALPVLWVRYPPMTDLPAHAAMIAAMVHWNDPGVDYPSLFRLNLDTPYLVPYGLAWLLAQVMPVVWAVKLLTAAGLVALPWSARLLLQRSDMPTFWAWLIFPTAFSHAFHWGFLTFVVATPLVLLFVAVYLPFARRPTWRRGVGVALFLLFLLLCHVVVAGVAGLVCLGTLVAHSRSLRDAARRGLPFVPAAIAAVGWLLLFAGSENQPEGWMPISVSLPTRLLLLPGILLGWGGSLAHSLAGGLLVALPFLLGARLSPRRHRAWPFVVCLGLYLLFPEMFFGVAQIGHRLAVFLLPFLLYALVPGDGLQRRQAPRRLVVFVASAGLLLATWPGFLAWNHQTDSFAHMIDAMEPHQRVLSMVFLNESESSPAPVYLHLPAWYAVEKTGVVDPSLATVEQIVVHYRDEHRPAVDHEFVWRPRSFDWQAHDGGLYDAFLVRAPRDFGAVLFPPGAVELVDRQGPWWLYRRVGPSAAPSPSERSAARPPRM